MNRSSKNRPTSRRESTTRAKSAAAAPSSRSVALSAFSANVTPSKVRIGDASPASSVEFGRQAVNTSRSAGSVSYAARRGFSTSSTKTDGMPSFTFTAPSAPLTSRMEGLTTSNKVSHVNPVVAAPQAGFSTMSRTTAPAVAAFQVQSTPQKRSMTTSIKHTIPSTSPMAFNTINTKQFMPSLAMLATLRGFSTEAVNPRNFLRDPKEVESRIINVLQSFEKIDKNKLNSDAHFQRDLGLDSLDRVEVMLAVEEEFNLEFSDEVSDRISSVKEAVEHISQLPDHEFKFAT